MLNIPSNFLLSLHQLRDWARPMETFIDCHDRDPACLTIDGDNGYLTRPDDKWFESGNSMILLVSQLTAVTYIILFCDIFSTIVFYLHI